MDSVDISISNDLAEIGKVLDMAEAFGKRHGLSERTLHDASIALDEIVSNIIHYAYHDRAPHRIVVRLCLSAGQLRIDIEDDGVPFHPLEQSTALPSGSAHERPVGGLGLLFVRSLMDDVSYARIGDANRLTLIKTAVAADPARSSSSMRWSETHEGEVIVVAVAGRLDSASTSAFEDSVLQSVGEGAQRLVLDLEGVDYVSSAGFWTLLALARTLEAHRGQLALCGLSPEVRRLFEIGHFQELFKIGTTRSQAIALLRGDSGGSA
jgi:anti-anti-sigma factor